VLAEAQRAQHATSLHLDRLKPAAVADLTREVIAQLKEALPAGFTDRLYQESEGLPYFLVEYLDALFIDPSGALRAEGTPNLAQPEWGLPDRVRDLLRLRIAQVDELARQLLAAAAVIGRSFDFETLVAASGRNESEALIGLETLLAHRLVEECGDCEAAGLLRYDFTHDKLRSLVYEETSLTRRRLLHQRVAEALAGSARRSRDPGCWSARSPTIFAWRAEMKMQRSTIGRPAITPASCTPINRRWNITPLPWRPRVQIQAL